MKDYSIEQLEENYNKFIEFLKKVFKNNPDRLENLLHMYSESELGTELTIAPASGKLHFHSAYVGGYIDHVMNVCRNAFGIKKLFAEQGGRINFTDEELFFAALHHDLGKLGDGEKPHYIPEESEWHRKNQGKMYDFNNDLVSMRTSERSVYYALSHGVKFTEEEYSAILMSDKSDDQMAQYHNSIIGELLKVSNTFAVKHEKAE
jgi:hypothetical protein